jgi:hypothetical protein
MCKCVLSIVPLRPGDCPSFYRPRGGGSQSCRTVLTTCGGMVFSATEWMAVLANLASGGCRGESCACPGAVSRVMSWEPLVWSLPMRWADGGLEVTQRQAWRCLVVLGSHSAQDGGTATGMAAQG